MLSSSDSASHCLSLLTAPSKVALMPAGVVENTMARSCPKGRISSRIVPAVTSPTSRSLRREPALIMEMSTLSSKDLAASRIPSTTNWFRGPPFRSIAGSGQVTDTFDMSGSREKQIGSDE